MKNNAVKKIQKRLHQESYGDREIGRGLVGFATGIMQSLSKRSHLGWDYSDVEETTM